MACQVGELWRTFTQHTFEIFNFTDQQLSFPSSAWIILYSNTIIWRIITCSPGDLGFSFFLLLKMTGALPGEQPTELIPDNLRCTSYTAPPPHALLWRFCKSILKAKGDSRSHQRPYKPPWFLQNSFMSRKKASAQTPLVVGGLGSSNVFLLSFPSLICKSLPF